MENIEFAEIINETPSKPCNSCKSKKGLNSKHILMITISVYILASSMYGTVKLFNNLITLFTR